MNDITRHYVDLIKDYCDTNEITWFRLGTNFPRKEIDNIGRLEYNYRIIVNQNRTWIVRYECMMFFNESICTLLGQYLKESFDNIHDTVNEKEQAKLLSNSTEHIEFENILKQACNNPDVEWDKIAEIVNYAFDRMYLEWEEE